MSDFSGYVMQAGELIPLLPLIVLTGASVWVMMAIGVRRHYRFALASTVIGLLLAGLLAHHLMAGPDPAPTPLLTMDGYAQFFTVLICALAIGVCLLAHNYWSEFDDQREEFFLLLLLATLGAVVLVGANHFASLLLGLETLSMSLYGMLAYPVQSRRQSGERPLEATVKYLILSAVSTAMILFGVALIYAETGSLFFAGLAELPAGPGLGQGPGPEIAYSVIALLLLAAGIAFKLSLFPFHIWTPDVYEGAPAPATAFLATIGKIAVAVVLLRLVGGNPGTWHRPGGHRVFAARTAFDHRRQPARPVAGQSQAHPRLFVDRPHGLSADRHHRRFLRRRPGSASKR